ncbi:hypothetical protein NEAUS04_2518, partial [Nematocida ausubeli]
KIRVWREEVKSIINMAGLDKDLTQLIIFLVPAEVESSLHGHEALDALLDAVCKFYEKKHRDTTHAVPKQENFLFIRDYYEAVQKRISGVQGGTIPDEKFQELVYTAFKDGLTLDTVKCNTYTPYKKAEEYVKILEDFETRLLEELKHKYEGKENLYRAMTSHTPTQPTYHKGQPYCALHKRYGRHRTEECFLRQKHSQEKQPHSTYKSKKETKEEDTKN